MKFNYFLSLLILLSINQLGLAQNKNILLIIADDVGVDPVPGYLPNATKAQMPNLEALMAEGLTFDNVWSNPLCSPTRATILTGRYGFRTNVLNAQSLSDISFEETSLHEYIDQTSNGNYSSSLIGKWHLGGSINAVSEYPNLMGIDYYAGLLRGATPDYFNWDLTINGQNSNSTEYITTKFTDLAIDWINAQNQPWFCWLAYNAPHSPFHLPPQEMHSQGNLPTDQAAIDANPLPYFLAMLESVDYEMGRLLENIPASVLENTVIIFIGDNGTDRNVIQAPYPASHGKISLYQGGVHVPMVIAGAGVNRQNEREAALVNSSDLFTTIVELTGNELSQIHDSYSFEHLLVAEGEGLRDCSFAEVETSSALPSGWTARDITYKVIEFDNGNQEFYNLIIDPYEENNLLTGVLNPTEQTSFDKLSLVFDDLSTPIKEQALSPIEFNIFPNPASDFIFIETNIDAQKEFILTDAFGKIFQNGVLQIGKNILETQDLPVGEYFIVVDGFGKAFVKIK